MHSPMAAKLLTELILDGASSTLDIGQFSSQLPHPFQEGLASRLHRNSA